MKSLDLRPASPRTPQLALTHTRLAGVFFYLPKYVTVKSILKAKKTSVAGSSSGRIVDSESTHLGSNPSPAVMIIKCIIEIEKFLSEHKIWLDIATASGALIFGLWQILINRRLKKLQDYVSLAAIPGQTTGKIELLNTGKINLYLWGFDMVNKKIRLTKPRIITAGTGNSSYYWIDTPNINEIGNNEFQFKVYLEDDFGKKWLSENGGEIIDGDKEGEKKIIVWSHKTTRSNWKFWKQPTNSYQSLASGK